MWNTLYIRRKAFVWSNFWIWFPYDQLILEACHFEWRWRVFALSRGNLFYWHSRRGQCFLLFALSYVLEILLALVCRRYPAKTMTNADNANDSTFSMYTRVSKSLLNLWTHYKLFNGKIWYISTTLITIACLYLVWYIYLTAYQIVLGYLMRKFDSFQKLWLQSKLSIFLKFQGNSFFFKS